MQKALVLGAGKSGVAAANFLASRCDRVVITDTKTADEIPLAARLDPRVETAFGSHPDSLLGQGPEIIVLSPGIPATIPILLQAKSLGIPVISEIELAFRWMKGTIIAITGSNGKSTTTALIGEILRVAGLSPIVAGNIGDPLTAAVTEEPRRYVIELSSFQLETIDRFHADIALLLNITPDHMDRYRSLEEYAAAKLRVFRNQTESDRAIVNGLDPRTSNPPTKAQVWKFSSSEKTPVDAFLDGGDLVLSVGSNVSRIPRSALKLEGTANVENALAAWLAAHAMGVTERDVATAFGSFSGLPHRMVLVREIEGVRYVNDSKGTNVDATIKSLEGQPDGRVLLILGGKDKGGEFERLRDLVARKVRRLLTIGSAAGTIEEALEGTTTIIPCRDMETAITGARETARPGDTVLLSPACASFDQYENFEHRGKHFEQLVRDLAPERAEGAAR